MLPELLLDDDGVTAALELLETVYELELVCVNDGDDDCDELAELDFEFDALGDAVIDVDGVPLTDAPVDKDADIDDVSLGEYDPVEDCVAVSDMVPELDVVSDAEDEAVTDTDVEILDVML